MDTFQSGQSHLTAPAYLERETPEDGRNTDLLISTEKVKGVILLRIDEIDSNNEAQPKEPGNKK